MVLKHLALGMAFLTLQLNQAGAEEIAVFSKILSTFTEATGGIKNVTFSAGFDTQVTGGPRKGNHYQSTVKYIGGGAWYKYEISNPDGSEPQFQYYTIAYDGKYYQKLTGQRLELSESEDKNTPLTYGKNVLLLPYSFLFSRSEDKPFPPYYSLRLSEWLDSKNWKNYFKSARFEGTEQINGHSCLVFSCPAKPDPRFGLEAQEGVFKIFFAKDLDYYPIKWERTSAQNDRYVYEIQDAGTLRVKGLVTPLHYPKSARLTKYFSGSDTPILVTTVKISSIDFNLDDVTGAFSVDPTDARVIHDVDKKLSIPVPK